MIKNYTVKDKLMGKRYDGKKSPLSDPVVLSVPEPKGVLDNGTPFNLAAPAGSWSDLVQIDYAAILKGTFEYGDASSDWVVAQLDVWNMTPPRMRNMSRHQSMELCDKLVRAAKKEMRRREELIEKMRSGTGAYVPGGRAEFRPSDENRRARTALHVKLRGWAAGPLRLERPQGSSLHHLADYDRGTGTGKVGRDIGEWFGQCQIVLVENDWGAAVPQIEGEWRVPFAFICWEFRISGVRVLAFTEADKEPNIMWCCYGADGHWVVDDFRYELGCPTLPRGIAKPGVNAYEFRRVARMCYDTIRASCIMLDAHVAHHERIVASVKLSERRAREGRAPLRDHYVVRLLHSEQRAYHVARTKGSPLGSGNRAPQRGHWRKGTWVHYDDQDSGRVQYTNDGGFVVSKTWRRWHWAGDPNNIIHKSYKL